MLLAVTCIWIPSVSGGKTSKYFCITLIWETLGLSSVLEMLVHIQALVFPTIFSAECEQKETVTDDTVHLKNDSTLNPRTYLGSEEVN